MRTKALLILGAVLAAAVTAGYTWKASADFPDQTTVAAGSYLISIELLPHQAKVMKPAALSVTISDQDGRPVENAAVEAKLFMPNMFCGTIGATLEPDENGVFIGETIAVMPGTWNADAAITIDGQTYTVKHRFEAMR